MWNGKVCVITGGAGGIGRALVKSFAQAGASVAFMDIDGPKGRELEQTLSKERVLFFEGDVGQQHCLEQFAQQIIRRFGCVDLLVNNACLTRKGIQSRCSWDAFNYVLQVGVTAPYTLTMLLLENFGVGASVVNISSSRQFMSQPDTESYTAAKGGIGALTHALSVSLAGNVRVNAVSPGWIDTADCLDGDPHSPSDKKQHPVGRVGVPKDIVQAVQFLASDQASFITGQNLVVDGGMTRQMIYHDDNGWTFQPN